MACSDLIRCVLFFPKGGENQEQEAWNGEWWFPLGKKEEVRGGWGHEGRARLAKEINSRPLQFSSVWWWSTSDLSVWGQQGVIMASLLWVVQWFFYEFLLSHISCLGTCWFLSLDTLSPQFGKSSSPHVSSKLRTTLSVPISCSPN